jgi:F-type H+-transporting ATPase subunit b
MTIQPSVSVWTVICFVVLMLVLDRLLFRPLLDFMDKRREKIDGARSRRQTALQEREEEQRRRDEEHDAAKKQAMQDAVSALEDTRQEYAAKAAEKRADNERRIAELRGELAKESETILASVDPRMDELVHAVADCVRIRGREEADASSREA